MTPEIISSFAIIVFAGLIHSSFQLSVSVLTLLSGHALGKKTRHLRVVKLMNSFIVGVFVLTTMLVSAIAYYFTLFIQNSANSEQLIASIACGILIGLGVATWAFYYRKGAGTALWLPRNFAYFLTNRTKVTRNHIEAFSLGMTSVVAEIIFTIGPVIAAALAIVTLPNMWWQLIGISVYSITSLLSLFAIFFMVSGGKQISHIQAWREKNKRFLQFAAGGSMLILAGFMFVDRVLGISCYGAF